MLEGFSGVNLIINKFDAKKQIFESEDIEAMINITGNQLGDILPSIFDEYKEKIPELSKVTVGAPATQIDMTKLIHIPISVNSIMTKTDFLATTQNYDITKISEGDRKLTETFLELQIGHDFFDFVAPVFFSYIKRSKEILGQDASDYDEEALAKNNQVFDAIKSTHTIAISTNDDGLAFTYNFAF